MDNKDAKQIKKHFWILKIVGITLLAAGVVLFVVGISNMGNFENNLFLTCGMGSMPILFVGILSTVLGFRPEMAKIHTKVSKHILEENRQDLTEIAETHSEINSKAITKTAKAVKEGLNDTVFCKHCGEKIDSDSNFCKHCGMSQK